jgi:hypothetical protein
MFSIMNQGRFKVFVKTKYFHVKARFIAATRTLPEAGDRISSKNHHRQNPFASSSSGTQKRALKKGNEE